MMTMSAKQRKDMFYKGRSIKQNTPVLVEVIEGADKYPVYALQGDFKGEVVVYTDKGIYLMDASFEKSSDKLMIKGRFRDFVPPIHQDVGRLVNVDKQGNFLLGKIRVLKYGMVSIFGNQIRIIP